MAGAVQSHLRHNMHDIFELPTLGERSSLRHLPACSKLHYGAHGKYSYYGQDSPWYFEHDLHEINDILYISVSI